MPHPVLNLSSLPSLFACIFSPTPPPSGCPAPTPTHQCKPLFSFDEKEKKVEPCKEKFRVTLAFFFVFTKPGLFGRPNVPREIPGQAKENTPDQSVEKNEVGKGTTLDRLASLMVSSGTFEKKEQTTCRANITRAQRLRKTLSDSWGHRGGGGRKKDTGFAKKKSRYGPGRVALDHGQHTVCFGQDEPRASKRDDIGKKPKKSCTITAQIVNKLYLNTVHKSCTTFFSVGVDRRYRRKRARKKKKGTAESEPAPTRPCATNDVPFALAFRVRLSIAVVRASACARRSHFPLFQVHAKANDSAMPKQRVGSHPRRALCCTKRPQGRQRAVKQCFLVPFFPLFGQIPV